MGGLARRLSIRLTEFCGEIFPGYLWTSPGSPPTASMIIRRPWRTAAGNAGHASITRCRSDSFAEVGASDAPDSAPPELEMYVVSVISHRFDSDGELNLEHQA